ncbi:MAG: ribosome silencing factor [Opitutaceae bacterium]|nr:ribosome silencing factor [Opitutaceae bacterium]
MVIEHDQTLTLLNEVVRALDDKKAADLRVLRVSAQSTITDYLVLATGTSEPHLRALRVELERVLDARKARIAGMDSGEPGSGWTVVDAYQIMIHLFVREKRDEYRLENLWKDAQELPVANILNPDLPLPVVTKAAEVPKKKRVVRKPVTKSAGRKSKSAKGPAAGKRGRSAGKPAKAKGKAKGKSPTSKRR